MAEQLVTERLLLRPWRVDDADAAMGVLLFGSVFFIAWAALTLEAGATWVARAIGM